jgi:hypothetical protein
MGALKQHFDDLGYFDYPHELRETFVDDSSYDEYRYRKQLEETRN